METLIHADIFFFITAIAVAVVGLGMAIALYFIIMILRDVHAVVQKIRKASDELEQDFEDFRATVKHEGVRIKTIVELVRGFIMRQVPKSRVKKKAEDVTPEKE
jgi:hypothetical protein